MSDTTLSFEAGTGTQFGDIQSERPAIPERLKVGLLGCAFFEYWRMFSAEFKHNVIGDLQHIANRLGQDVDLVYPHVVDTLDAADGAGRAFAQAGIKMLVVVEGTYVPDYISLQAISHVPDVPVVIFTTQVAEDISPGDDYETLMRNSAMIGTAQLSATFVKMGWKYDIVVGSLCEQRPFDEIVRLARVRHVAARLRNLNIGLIGQVFRGMYDLEMDKTRLRGAIGPSVISIDASHLIAQWENVSESEADAAAQAVARRFRMRGPRREDLHRSVRLGLAMERLIEHLRLDSLCFLGQHYIEKKTGAPARLGGSMIMEQGRYLVASEGDLAGLTMMHMLWWLTGNSPLQAEWGQYHASRNALLLVGHGVSSPALAGSDDRITLTGSPEEWGFEGEGVNMEFILKPGRVTMGHLLERPGGWQMSISGGNALDFPCLPCKEIHALVQIERPVKEYVADVQRRGVAHHVIIAHGEARAELELLAGVLGIQSFTV